MAERRRLVAVALGLLMVGTVALADETAAKDAIKKLGGSVDGEFKRPGSTVQIVKPVKTVNFTGTKITDAQLITLMPELLKLKELQRLILDGTKVTDEGLKDLKAIKNLRLLVLEKTNVTDTGMKYVKLIETLEVLALGSTKVTDAGLKELAEMKNLEQLIIDNTNVTDAGLKHLQKIMTLKCVAIGGTKVTDAGVNALKKALPKVRFVR